MKDPVTDSPLDAALEAEEWDAARALIRRELRRDPDNHWLLAVLSNTYYEQRRYAIALRPARRAHTIAPWCAFAAWHYAGALDATGRHREAITVWKGVLRRGVQRVAFGRCGEGLRWTASLFNDIRYRLGLAHHALGELAIARRCLREHLANRAPGLPSLYTRGNALRRLDMVATLPNSRRSGG